MKKSILLFACALGVTSLISCSEAPRQETTAAEPVVAEAPVAPDPAQVKADIIAIETAWAAAINAKDIDALMALYADDAISMPPGEPIVSGKEALRKKAEMEFAEKASFASLGFETMDVYAQGDFATEVGVTKFLDAAGKESGRGKYIAVFEKRDGKYLCIREIYNRDSKK